MRSINWSHNGKWMVTTDDRGFIKYWQINFNNVHTYQAHSEPVRSSRWETCDCHVMLMTCLVNTLIVNVINLIMVLNTCWALIRISI